MQKALLLDHASPQRSPIVAAFLSIIPGLGQIYAGYTARGIGLLGGMILQVTALGVMNVLPFAAWLVLIWLWNIRDAYDVARGRPGTTSLPLLIAIIINFSAGWYVTKINLVDLVVGIPNMQHIVTELLQPETLEPATIDQVVDAKFVVPGPRNLPAPVPVIKENEPYVVLRPTVAQPGEVIQVEGFHFHPHQRGSIMLFAGSDVPLAKMVTDERGHFVTEFINPMDSEAEYFVEVKVAKPTYWLGMIPAYRPTENFILSVKLMVETIYMALMGTLISIIISIPLSFLGARNLMMGTQATKTVYYITRTAFNVLRSIEALIIAVIFAVIVGIGPFAGVLALAVHGIGALGKLYSEAIESIDPGPIEAITATGASRLQTVIYAVVPQVVPQFIAFTLYRWDIHVRMSTIIGLVGGGGIGFILIQYINLVQWNRAGTAIWLIAIVVMIMDYASAVIREMIV